MGIYTPMGREDKGNLDGRTLVIFNSYAPSVQLQPTHILLTLLKLHLTPFQVDIYSCLPGSTEREVTSGGSVLVQVPPGYFRSLDPVVLTNISQAFNTWKKGR